MNPLLTRSETLCILFICFLSSICSVYVLVKSEYVHDTEWQTTITAPSVIITTPLDSPNPCWDPVFWSKID